MVSFDNVDHQWLIRFIEHRISDKRILRLIDKWLRAGVSEDGEWSKTTVGTPQGAVISPLLANVYLHYVLDLWIEHWRKQRGRKDVVVVRYVDDFVIGFESKADAEACLEALRERFGKFGLSPGEDAFARVRSLRDPTTTRTRGRPTGNVRLSWFHAPV